MKAIRVREFGPPQVMNLEETEKLIPANNQVVIKLSAIGVNPVDAYCRSGAASWVSVPFTPGVDGAGTITRIGAEVAHLQRE